MKISFFDVKDVEEKCLKDLTKRMLPEAEVIINSGVLCSEKLQQCIDSDAICFRETSNADKKILDSLPNLKLVLARTTGFDNIDLAKCKERGVPVCNVPSYGEHTVAEFAFALILTLSRKICESMQSVRETGKFCTEGLTGVDLYGKTMGVIGTGRIGQHVAEIAKGFGMIVIAHDAFPRPELQKEIGFTYESFDNVFAKIDFLSLHVPYMKETHHLVNQETFAKMKTGAYIINTSRGAVIDTEAMKSALESGKLGGAGLDVLEDESCEVDKELLAMKNVVITPHNAFNSQEAIDRRIKTTLENVLAFMKGIPQNVVK